MDCVKVKYTAERFALMDIQRISKTSKRQKIPVRAYFCKCGFWHLTSKIDRKDEQIRLLEIEKHLLKQELDKLKNSTDKEDRIIIKTDARIKEFQKAQQKMTQIIKRLRADNRDLICKNIQLQKNQKVCAPE